MVGVPALLRSSFVVAGGPPGPAWIPEQDSPFATPSSRFPPIARRAVTADGTNLTFRMNMKNRLCLLLVLALDLAPLAHAASATAGPKSTRIDARMTREPDVSATQIAFVYAGDIWVAPKTGGEALRLSSPRGEESFPKFSPDGSQLAFSGNYDGNMDIYLMPATCGPPRRLTHHGAPDRMVGWYPDGKSLLYATTMTSYKDRFNQLYRVAATGGLPEKLPVPYGEFGAISPDGRTLAYTPISVDFRTWKRYRGGMNPDISAL